MRLHVHVSQMCIKKVINSVFDLKKGGVFVQDAVNGYVIKINSTQGLIGQFDNSPQQCTIFMYSLPHVTVSIPFSRILIRIHISIMGVQLKLIQGEKPNISLALYLLLPWEIYMNKNNCLPIFIIGNVLNIELWVDKRCKL